MKLYSHLKLSRHGIYYFRCIIPKVLRPLYNGKTEVKYSLNTRCPVTAKRESYILSAKTAHLFEKAKKTMSWHDPKNFDPNDMSTWPTQNDKLRNYEISESNGLYTIKTDPRVPDDHKNALEAIGMLKSLAQPQPQTRPAQPQSTAIKLSVAIKNYLKVRSADEPNAKTIIDMKGILERFLAWTSPYDPQVDLITKKMMGDYVVYLLTVAFNHRLKKAGLSKKTVSKHISFLSTLFRKLQTSEDYPPNIPLPTDGITPYVKNEKRRATKAHAYKPFTDREIAKIFNPANLNALVKPHEFWVPLLGLYSGARINELSQPYLDDITCENNIWRLHIHSEDGNRTKNESSVRVLPLHRDLIALGILDYLEDVREVSPEGRMFPYLLESSLNGFGDVPSESFGRYLSSLGIVSEKKVFHSFRSTLTQYFTGKDVSPTDKEELLGHAIEGTNHLVYDRKKTAEELFKDVVSKISFKQISENIDALRYTKGKFSPILKAEIARRTKQQNHLQAKKARQKLAATQKKLMEQLSA